MSETIRYTNSAGTAQALTIAGTVKYRHGEGIDTWQVEPLWEAAQGSHTLSGYGMPRRRFTLTFAEKTSTYDALRGTLTALSAVMMYDVSRSISGADQDAKGTIEVVLDAGGTYSMRVAPAGISVDGPNYRHMEVNMSFEGDSQLWRKGGVTSAAGTMTDGTIAGALAFNNAGDYHTWPRFTLTGAAGTPVLTYPNARALTVGTAMAGTLDVLRIYTDPPLIEYVAGGTAAAVRWTGYAGTASHFEPLPIGAGTVTLTAASGTLAASMEWDTYVAGLGR